MLPFRNKISLSDSKILAIAIAIVGALIATWGSYELHKSNLKYAKSAVQETASVTANAINERFKLYQYGLRSTKSVILTVGENDISRKKFVQYSQVQNIDTEFPGARGFGFIRRVPTDNETAFLLHARADDATDFSIRQLTPNSIERYVIQYVEPAGRNNQAIGLDIGSEPTRRKAADDAMKTGTVQLSGPITLVQATGNPKQSFLILLPIYRADAPLDTEQARVAAAFGWSYAPLLMEEVLADLDIYDGTFDLELIDVTDPTHAVSFFRNLPSTSLQKTDFTNSSKIDLFGRVWMMEFTATPEFIAKLNLLPPETVLAIGSAASIGLGVLFAVVMSNRRNKREAMAQRAELVSIVESSFDAIIGRNLDGVITTWNPGASTLFGYTEEEALGQSFDALLVPPSLQQEELQLQRQLERGIPIQNFETQRLRKDGTHIDVSATASPIRSKTGQIIGSSKTMRDFTDQKEAQKRINEINTHLEALVHERTAKLTDVNFLLTNILRAASEVAIIATNENGVITVFNSGAENLFGYKASEVISTLHVSRLFAAAELKEYAAKLSANSGADIPHDQALFYEPLKGNPTANDWTQTRKDTTEFAASTVISEIQSENGCHGGFLCVSIDITQQYNFRHQLEAARNQLQMAADIAEMGVWSWELSTDALQWNQHMFKIYGYPESMQDDDVTFEHWRSRIAPDELEDVQKRLFATVEGTGVFDICFNIVTPAGEKRTIQTGANVERNENGTPIRVIGFNRDITDQIRREELLEQARESADRANVAKSNFLANMSHEIRTPMNAILGMLQLTQQTNLTATQSDFLAKAQGSAKSLLRILNDILDYSKIEAGKMELDFHDFELSQLLEDLGNILYGYDQNNETDLVFDISPDLPERLISDSLKLQQVLINIAGNALKFTQNGYVCISVYPVKRTQTAPARLRFAIEDTGIGISDEQLSRLFTGFTQAEASTTRRFGGTGLGLVISQSILSALGGTVEVKSQIGKGSIFSFELDFDLPPSANQEPDLTEKMHSGESVYLLSSMDYAAPIYQRSLELLKYDVTTITSLAILKAAMHNRSIENSTSMSFVVDEHQLSDDNARDLVKFLSLTNATNAQVVSLSRGKSKLRQIDKKLRLRNIQKPFISKQLHAALEGSPNQRDTHDTIPPNPQPLRLEGLRILVVEDNTLNREVAKGLLQSEGAIVDLAVNGADGVEKALAPDCTYDFVIMDVQMPVMDGLEATREIRTFKTKIELPIIAMTANASHADREECLAAGMNEHLGKPINLDEFVSLMLRIKGTGSMPQALNT
ncbi:CHASE domain-containing protein [Thalassospira alkalitolerans]|uniref:PAS domain-containing hybrid sensor histidine kinase/response regulator n=1 Tax=Thalassospira alkalitolerans TaxID=1293890 RepID=UPI003AA81E4C